MLHINLHCLIYIRFTTAAHHSVPCLACKSPFITVSPYRNRQFLGFGPLFRVGPFPFFFFFFLPGLRRRSRDRSWSRTESTALAGVGVGAGVGKILPTPAQARLCRMPKSIDDNYGRTGMHRLENIDRTKGEWQCGDKDISPFGDGIRSEKGFRRSFYGHRDRSVTVSINSRLSYLSTFQEINDLHGRLHPHLGSTESVSPVRMNLKWKPRKWLRHAYCSF